MDIRPLLEEMTYVLDAHAEHELTPNPDYPENVEGLSDDMLLELPSKQLQKRVGVKPDAPVFVYKPLNPRERAKWANKLWDDGVSRTSRSNAYLDLFEERLIRVENFTIGGETFDKKNPVHVHSIPLGWQTEVAMIIFTTSNLSEEDAGK